MHIWVDADACPGVIKEIIYRAAERRQIPTTLVANQMLRTPPSKFIRAIQVAHGFDVADAHIVDQVMTGDLVVTADIDRKSTRLNSSHDQTPYAVFCLKKKRRITQQRQSPVKTAFRLHA